jgi:hypothetical protein
MVVTGFSDLELQSIRSSALNAMLQRLIRGINHYPNSVEIGITDSITIPVKFGHRRLDVIHLLERALAKEFNGPIPSWKLPRSVVYQWLRAYYFPRPDETIQIYDVKQGKYIRSDDEYRLASDELLAEGQELTLILKPSRNQIVDVVRFISKRGGKYATTIDDSIDDSTGALRVNQERLNDSVYATPMILTSYDDQLLTELSDFSPVRKLFTVRGNEEISTYIDKKYPEYLAQSLLKLESTVLRLANKLFRDYINFDEHPLLAGQ